MLSKPSGPLGYHLERVTVLRRAIVRGASPVELSHHLATRRRARRAAPLACLVCVLMIFASAGCSSTAPVRRTVPHVPVVSWQLSATGPEANTPGEAPVPTKDISGAAPGANPSVNFLAASCASAGFCAVVGQYTDATGSLSGLIDLLSNGAWRSYAAPEPANNPAGSGPGDNASGSAYSGLNAVSCPVAGFCVAVGTYKDEDGRYWGLIDTFSSGTWRAMAAPEPPKDSAGEAPSLTETQTGLTSVSCTSAINCVAVGSYDDAVGFYYGLIETLSKGAWSPLEAPEPLKDGLGAGRGTDSNSYQFAGLNSVACTSATFCTAVGRYKDANAVEWPLIDMLSGTQWDAVAGPEPVRNASGAKPGSQAQADGGSYLLSVTCVSRASCTAVGAYLDSSTHIYGLIDSFRDGAWRGVAAPEPATDISRVNAGTDADQEEGATLAAVACTSPAPCISVGSYKDSKGFQIGLIDVLDRGTWNPLAAPEPSTDSLAGQPGSDATGEAGTALKSATCLPTGLCLAVGTYNDSKGNSVGLIDMLRRGIWRAVPVPAPESPFQLGILVRQTVTVQAVSCAPDGFCVLGGNYQDTAGNTFGLIDTYAA
jgi:hypothetical protein